MQKKNEKVFCVIDSKIRINLNFNNQKNIKIIFVNCGEKVKTFDGYKNLAEKLIKKDINRRSVVLSLLLRLNLITLFCNKVSLSSAN